MKKIIISWKIQKWIFHFRKKNHQNLDFLQDLLVAFLHVVHDTTAFLLRTYKGLPSLSFSHFQHFLFSISTLLRCRASYLSLAGKFFIFLPFFSSSNVILSSEGKFDPKFQSMSQLTQMNKRKHFILLYRKVESQMNRNDDLITEIKPFSFSRSSPFSTDLVCHGTFDVRWLLHSSACRLTFAWPGRDLSKLSSRNLEEQRLTQLGGGESRERIAKRMSGNFFYLLFLILYWFAVLGDLPNDFVDRLNFKLSLVQKKGVCYIMTTWGHSKIQLK